MLSSCFYLCLKVENKNPIWITCCLRKGLKYHEYSSHFLKPCSIPWAMDHVDDDYANRNGGLGLCSR